MILADMVYWHDFGRQPTVADPPSVHTVVCALSGVGHSGTLGPVARPFRQVDVFTTTPYTGNPVAVVLDGDGLSTHQMQRFANWTNLSETTFVLPPSAPGADYQVRIFSPEVELPFAGHPTLGTCHAWLSAGGGPMQADVVMQQCSAGLITVRRTADGLAFAAPPLVRSGPVDESLVRRIASVLGIDRADILDAEWADNGPGWVAVLLQDADAVLALRPGLIELPVGVVGPYPEGSPLAFEVRAFLPKQGSTAEDPVTGSLNASLAEWLLRTGRARTPYVASQGTALGRAGRVHISRDADGTIWVAGGTVTCISGQVDI
jgi:PhzF family phenazine biosynthesis protein